MERTGQFTVLLAYKGDKMQLIIQVIAVLCFLILGIIDFKNGLLDFAGVNLSLFFLYIFLYLTPFSKLFK